MSIAGVGLIPNPPQDVGVAIAANTESVNQYYRYTNSSFVSNVITLVNTAVVENSGGNISNSTLTGIISLGSNSFPALTDNLTPGNVMSNILVFGTSANTAANIYLVSSALAYDVVQILGNSDLSKFCQTFQAAQGYVVQANQVLNSVKNSNILDQTFNPAAGGMNTLSTGGINQLTTDPYLVGEDFASLGQLISLSNLNDLGLPGELLAQIGRVTNGGMPALSELLINAEIPNFQVELLSKGDNQLTSQQEKIAYSVLNAVTGDLLTQTLVVLGITLKNITNLAQLLDPKQTLPNSYLKLVCPTTTLLAPVYLANGAINTALESTLSNALVSAFTGPNNTNSLGVLKLIIPPDQAVANKAMARSMQQIKGIANSTLPALSAAMRATQTLDDLPLVQGLTKPVPGSVTTFYQSQLGQGTGPNGTLRLVDIIGLGSGYNITSNLSTVSNSIANLYSSGSLDTLSQCYDNMIGTLGNVFGGPVGNVVIPTGPGAGTYASWDEAFETGLLPAANAAIASIVSTGSANVSSANSAWGNIINSMLIQTKNQIAGTIDFGNLTDNSTSSSLTFAEALHEYGVDVSPGGSNEYLVSVANQNSLSGQSLLASLKEGRNIAAMEEAGLALDTQLDDTLIPGPEVEPLTTVPWSRYSAAWSKSSTLVNTDRNWGLYRSYLGANPDSNWGTGGTVNQSGTVSLKASGKNVDVIIVDAVIDPEHPEFAVDSNGTGGSRVKYVNWYGLDVPENPAAGQTYNPPITTTAPNSADDSRHATFVAGVVAGNTQGWAPNANIYNISPQYVTGGVQYLYLYKYILAWHNAKRAAGNMTPTIVNNSWYSRYTIPYTSITSVTWRGTTFTGPFTTTQLEDFGITNNGAGYCIVSLQNSIMDQDIQNCIRAGIIMVCCAGNDGTRISIPGDIDFNNSLTATGFNFGQGIFYARGSSPIATENLGEGTGTICVGAISSAIASPGADRKANFSNSGPRVDLFAPGSYITSSWLTSTTPTGVGYPAPVQDPRNSAYYIAKYSGTSFAAPQVTGILACALEATPTLDQAGARRYILENVGIGQIPTSGTGYTAPYSLQGAPNNYLAVPVGLRL